MEGIHDREIVNLVRVTCSLCGGSVIRVIHRRDKFMPPHKRICPYLHACLHGRALDYERVNGDPMLVEILE